MAAALDAILAAPSGRAAAQELARENATVRISLRPRTDPARAAETDVWHGAPHVFIDPAPAAAFPANLAHELLGHALRDLQARRAGVEQAYGMYEGNELEASLLGWLVAVETGRAPGPAADEFLADPSDFQKRLEVSALLYAGAVPLEALGDPVPVLRRRRARCDRYIARLDAALSRKSLGKGLRSDYERSLVEISAVAKGLDELIADDDSPEGRRRLAAVRASVSSEAGRRFFVQAESRVSHLRARFLRVAARRSGSPP